MCDDFREASRNLYPIYYDGDGHWLPVGHQVAASILYRALTPCLKMRESADPAIQAGKVAAAPTR
jgi:hypothetical protein